MNSKIKFCLLGSAFAVILLHTNCSIKEYTDPSSISDKNVISTVDGLLGLCNGMQYRYTVGRQSPLYQGFSASGLMSYELKVLNVGNADEANLSSGLASVTAANTITGGLWTQSYLLLNEANRVLDHLSVATNSNTKAVIQGYSSIYKALALGTLATYFEKMPVTLGKNQPFVTRNEALAQAVALLSSAEAALAAATAANPAEVNAAILKVVAGVDLKNTLVALQARYNVMLKDYPKALAAANKVDLTKKSAFKFDPLNANPIFFVSYSNRNVVEPNSKTLGLLPGLIPDTLNDKRLAFYLNPLASPTVNLGYGFARTSTSDIPVYLPGEMRLIKAECLAQTDLVAATAELDGVIKKKPAEDAWGVGSDMAAGYTGVATKDAILTEIYRQRCIELCNTGLRLEDSRRFNRPGPDQPLASRERGRDFMPYPQTERDNNSNTPADPLK
jgi:starch-binding outer membrane protein, SusD/RagB family